MSAPLSATPVAQNTWRAWVSGLMLTFAVVLSPLAVAAPWANTTLTNTDAFVATFEPLAHEQTMTDFVVDRSMRAIEDRVDFDALAASAVNGLTSLGTGDSATQLLELAKAPLASTMRNSVRDGINALVTSDQFPAVWAQVLRQSHAQILGVVSGDNSGVVTASDGGEITLNFGPIIDAVRARLADQGFAVATLVPSINPTVVIAQSDAIPTIQVFLNLLTLAGYWLPIIVGGLLIGGVAFARRRAAAVLRTSLGMLVAMGAFAAVFGGVAVVMPAIAASAGLPIAVMTLLFTSTTAELQRAIDVVAVIAGLTAALTWILGPFAWPSRFRAFAGAGLDRARARAERAGVSTGRFGLGVYRFRYAAYAVIGIVCVSALALTRPLSVSSIVWTVIVSALAALAVLVVQRPQPKNDQIDDGAA